MAIDDVNFNSVEELCTLDDTPPNGASFGHMCGGAPEMTAENTPAAPTMTAKMDMNLG